MGFYSRYVLPGIIDVAMRNEECARLRAAWIPRARGDVLEVGIGSGLNLPFYSPAVRSVCGVDPSAELQRRARERAAGRPFPVTLFQQSAEEPLPVPDASVDTAVVTWTLCSIPDPRRALERIRRALKADGRLIFLEHGRAPDAAVAAWQDRLTPLWRRIGGGCHLNRPLDQLVAAAGFRMLELQAGYLPGPRPMTYTFQGLAEPR
jgi:ubiquinone/menaquinone biosynthesis C-methylase UbiE